MAELSSEPPAEQADPLAALVGRTRATLLAMLGLPRTRTQLAEQLVTARRRGRMVLYQRTAAATALLAAIRADQATG